MVRRADGWGTTGAGRPAAAPVLEAPLTPAELAVPRRVLLQGWRCLERLVFATDGRFDSDRFHAAREAAETALRAGPRLYERRKKKRP
ncbi:MAG: hypothetical protein M3167_06010 [Acidobacteriota bacterium]|nr:hypothetical protein [Acidobacteriota bacterium]